jgi:hypothetical protein
VENTYASLGIKKPPQVKGRVKNTSLENIIASLGLKKPPYGKYI